MFGLGAHQERLYNVLKKDCQPESPFDLADFFNFLEIDFPKHSILITYL